MTSFDITSSTFKTPQILGKLFPLLKLGHLHNCLTYILICCTNLSRNKEKVVVQEFQGTALNLNNKIEQVNDSSLEHESYKQYTVQY